MSADSLLQVLTQAIFVAVFVAVCARAARHPARANVDTALLFLAFTLIIALQWITGALHVTPASITGATTGALLMALPYLLLRLVDDFAHVPRALMWLAAVGLALAVAVLVVYELALQPPGAPLPLPVTLALVAYFVTLMVYAAARFITEARRASGVTRRRLQAVAAGSLLLGLLLVLAPLQMVVPRAAGLWQIASRLLGLNAGLGYFIGFAPPAWLRRAWQEPELRAFLGRAAALPHLPDRSAIVEALERGAAAALGVPGATVGLWDEDEQALRFQLRGPALREAVVRAQHLVSQAPFHVEGGCLLLKPGRMIAGRAFAQQQVLLTTNPKRDDPAHAPFYDAVQTRAILAAPITAGERRLGVLVVYAPRAPVFAEEDLYLVRLLADQVAVVLESHALIKEAARVRALEEATRLKDDFLSAAAHDLKTPLTTLLAQAQLLARKAEQAPDAPTDRAGIERIIAEARRMSALVNELLDAARVGRGRLIGARVPVDLTALAAEVCARWPPERCVLVAPEPVVGEYDSHRITQVIEQLVENAVKYSPNGEPVTVQVWSEGDQARLSVADRGIGIPPGDLPHIFDRFYRAANVDDRQFAGMGLGLSLCRSIVEQHGGRIWATSTPGRGSTFQVALPIKAGGGAA